jgi:methyl-accepting chemotaxis protein
MRLRIKLLAGFILINALLIVAGTMSIFELTKMRSEAISIIDGNYKTLHRLNLMLIAVEKEDKAVLMLMLGQWKKGRTDIARADSSFNSNYARALKNSTTNQELEMIGKQYAQLKHIWELPIVDTKKQGNINWYFTSFLPTYQSTIEQIEKAMEISQQTLHKESRQLLEDSHKAIMPGIVAIISAIILSLLMYFFTTRFFSKPIEDILKGLIKYNNSGKSFSVAINTNDEIKELAKEIKKATENR